MGQTVVYPSRGDLPPFTIVAKTPAIRGLSPEAYLLYVRCLLDHRNNESGEAWPSWETMVAESGVPKNRITECLTELQAAGLITRLKRKGTNGAIRYVVHNPALPHRPPSDSHFENPKGEAECSPFERPAPPPPPPSTPLGFPKWESWDSQNEKRTRSKELNTPPPTPSVAATPSVPATPPEMEGGDVRSGDWERIKRAFGGGVGRETEAKARAIYEGDPFRVTEAEAEAVRRFQTATLTEAEGQKIRGGQCMTFHQFVRTWPEQVARAKVFATLRPVAKPRVAKREDRPPHDDWQRIAWGLTFPERMTAKPWHALDRSDRESIWIRWEESGQGIEAFPTAPVPVGGLLAGFVSLLRTDPRIVRMEEPIGLAA